MRWQKLGKIFDPTEHKLPSDCHEFAQSPQTLVFDDFVRIYFSTRAKDKSGKYLSHIAFVDFDKAFKKILRVSSEPIIELGKLGCFDEHGIFPINIFRDKDKIVAYTTGWSRRISVSVETSIGIAYSDNKGLTFKKMGDGPILTSSLHEPFLVGDGFVKCYDKVYYMWYIYGTKWSTMEGQQPDRVYKIGYATSKDGISWIKQDKQLIEDKLNVDECQALPTILKIKDRYHMYFCYRQATGFRKDSGKAYRIGYAYSDDLISWIRDDDNKGIDVTPGSWDSDMMCYPHIFHCDDKVYLLYNGNEFGRFGFGLAILEEEK